MPVIIIKMDGADAVRERLQQISRRVANMSPIMKAIGDRVTEQTKRRFKAAGPAPDGKPWAPPKTPNPKRIRTLTVYGHLRDSIHFQLMGPNAVAIGTNRAYAAIHQLGGKTSPSVIVPKTKKALKTPYGLFKKGETSRIGHPRKAVSGAERPKQPGDYRHHQRLHRGGLIRDSALLNKLPPP